MEALVSLTGRRPAFLRVGAKSHLLVSALLPLLESLAAPGDDETIGEFEALESELKEKKAKPSKLQEELDALIKQDKELRNSGYTRDIAEFDNQSNPVLSDEISILDHRLAQILVERVTDLEPLPSALLDPSQLKYSKPVISGEKAQQLWNEWVAEAERLLNS